RLMTDLDAEASPGVAALADRLRMAPEAENTGVRVQTETLPRVSIARPASSEIGALADSPNRAGARAGMPERRSRGGTTRAMRLAGVALSALVLATLAVKPTPATHSKRVVVAIFENATGDASLAHVGAMAADWITQGLQKTGLVDVVPGGAALVFGVSDSAGAASGRGIRAIRDLARVSAAGY